jgi:hypothetical protein
VTIRQNGYVFWSNLTPDSVDVTFDDATNVQLIPQACASPVFAANYCQAGNISAFSSAGGFFQSTRGRQFPVPGVYPYHSTRTGKTGRVVVVADQS